MQKVKYTRPLFYVVIVLSLLFISCNDREIANCGCNSLTPDREIIDTGYVYSPHFTDRVYFINSDNYINNNIYVLCDSLVLVPFHDTIVQITGFIGEACPQDSLIPVGFESIETVKIDVPPLSMEEYEVYEAILNHDHPNDSIYLIWKYTGRRDRSGAISVHWIPEKLNQKFFFLEEVIDTLDSTSFSGSEYQLQDENTLPRITTTVDSLLNNSVEDTVILLNYFSRVAFDGDYALVSYERQFMLYYGDASYILLRKINNKWQITDRFYYTFYGG